MRAVLCADAALILLCELNLGWLSWYNQLRIKILQPPPPPVHSHKRFSGYAEDPSQPTRSLSRKHKNPPPRAEARESSLPLPPTDETHECGTYNTPHQPLSCPSVAIFDQRLQIPALNGHKRNQRQFLLLLLCFNTVFDRAEAAGANMQSN